MKSDYAKLVSRTTLAIFLLLAAAALLAGCGGGSQEEQGSEGEQGSQEEEETATSAQGGGDATAQTVAATEAFLATLDDAQREQVSFEFDDPLKSNWTNFPVRFEPRNGVALVDMTEDQQ
jgi:ABC-type glycerol-3-phosphate transport system substrate-binding protein